MGKLYLAYNYYAYFGQEFSIHTLIYSRDIFDKVRVFFENVTRLGKSSFTSIKK